MKPLAVVLLMCVAFGAAAQPAAVPVHVQRGIDFVPNNGQWQEQVLYHAALRHCNVYLENDGIMYHFSHPANAGAVHDHINQPGSTAPILKFHAYRMTMVGASLRPVTVGNDAQDHYYNYLLGNDPAGWQGGIHPYTSVNYKAVYPGIGLYAASQEGRFMYDFIVEPGADPSLVRLRFDGVDYLRVRNNKLHIGTSVGEIVEDEPYAYQDIDGSRKQVACRYRVEGNTVSFVFPRGYDPRHTLVIDPVVVFATFTGSTTDNWGCTATFDDQGNFYAGGVAFGFGYPVTVGAFQTNYASGYCDVSITKYNPTGNAMIYSTYLGGSSEDRPHSMIVDGNGNLLVTGHTSSTNFPTTAGAVQTTYGGGSFDMFVTKLNPAGSGLVGSTFLGGSSEDGNNEATPLYYNYGDNLRGEVIIDDAGNVYVAGNTRSSNFPTVNASQTNLSGLRDGVAVKLNPGLTQLLWSTYLGGSGSDAAYNIVLSNDEAHVFVSGGTTSNNFPTTTGVYQQLYGGGSADGFIARYQNGGSFPLQRATYVGRPQYDQCFGLQIDWEGNVYTTGQTLGGTFPVSPGVYSNANSSQFLLKLDPNLNAALFSTVFGSGSSSITNICPTAFMVDTCGSIYISGWGGPLSGQGNSNTFGLPVTPDAIKPITDGEDFYFIVFTQNAQGLLYATYMGQNSTFSGGEHVDGGTSRFNKAGEIYQAICGGCSGTSFPTTPGAWSTTNNSTNCNMVSLKIAFQLVGAYAQANVVGSGSGCVPFTATFQNTSANATGYEWHFGDGSPVSTETNPTHTYTTPGTYTVMLVAVNSAAVCASSDTTYLTVMASTAAVSLGPDTTICEGNTLVLSPGPASLYQWQNGATSPTLTVATPGTYAVTITNAQGCTAADEVEIGTAPLPQVDLGSDTVLCVESPVWLDAGNDGAEFLWSNGATTQSVIVNSTAVYAVTVTLGLCSAADAVNVTYLPFQQVDLGPDTTVCDGIGTMLYANIANPPYVWSTGATTSSIFVATEGWYWVTVGSATCASSDSVHFALVPSPQINLGPDTLICYNDTLVITTPDRPYTFLWHNGETGLSVVVRQPPQLVTLRATLGTCTIEDKKLVARDPCLCIYVPNAFSPNGDGLNDRFQIVYCPVQNYIMRIYNRWGEKVWETNDPDASWDGRFKGDDAPVGVYVYYIQCTAEGIPIFREGNVTLLR